MYYYLIKISLFNSLRCSRLRLLWRRHRQSINIPGEAEGYEWQPPHGVWLIEASGLADTPV